MCGSYWWNSCSCICSNSNTKKVSHSKGWKNTKCPLCCYLWLKVSYVLASWEGSAHDSHVLNDALSRQRGLKIILVMVVMEFGKELSPLIVVFVTIWKSLVITRQEMTKNYSIFTILLYALALSAVLGFWRNVSVC